MQLKVTCRSPVVDDIWLELVTAAAQPINDDAIATELLRMCDTQEMTVDD
jgi:hypothetical protein